MAFERWSLLKGTGAQIGKAEGPCAPPAAVEFCLGESGQAGRNRLERPENWEFSLIQDDRHNRFAAPERSLSILGALSIVMDCGSCRLHDGNICRFSFRIREFSRCFIWLMINEFLIQKQGCFRSPRAADICGLRFQNPGAARQAPARLCPARPLAHADLRVYSPDQRTRRAHIDDAMKASPNLVYGGQI
ncbi:hypothetical protein M728_005754 (plasmid) [Ensifer sp. WSM1721]